MNFFYLTNIFKFRFIIFFNELILLVCHLYKYLIKFELPVIRKYYLYYGGNFYIALYKSL
jgi:hypothetical protein